MEILQPGNLRHSHGTKTGSGLHFVLRVQRTITANELSARWRSCFGKIAKWVRTSEGRVAKFPAGYSPVKLHIKRMHKSGISVFMECCSGCHDARGMLSPYFRLWQRVAFSANTKVYKLCGYRSFPHFTSNLSVCLFWINLQTTERILKHQFSPVDSAIHDEGLGI